MIRELVEIIHGLILEEDEIGPLYDEVPRDLKDRVDRALLNARFTYASYMTADDRYDAQLRFDALDDIWKKWLNKRMTKILALAKDKVFVQADPDLGGILPWERTIYEIFVRTFEHIRVLQSPGGG